MFAGLGAAMTGAADERNIMTDRALKQQAIDQETRKIAQQDQVIEIQRADQGLRAKQVGLEETRGQEATAEIGRKAGVQSRLAAVYANRNRMTRADLVAEHFNADRIHGGVADANDWEVKHSPVPSGGTIAYFSHRTQKDGGGNPVTTGGIHYSESDLARADQDGLRNQLAAADTENASHYAQMGATALHSHETVNQAREAAILQSETSIKTNAATNAANALLASKELAFRQKEADLNRSIAQATTMYERSEKHRAENEKQITESFTKLNDKGEQVIDVNKGKEFQQWLQRNGGTLYGDLLSLAPSVSSAFIARKREGFVLRQNAAETAGRVVMGTGVADGKGVVTDQRDTKFTDMFGKGALPVKDYVKSWFGDANSYNVDGQRVLGTALEKSQYGDYSDAGILKTLKDATTPRTAAVDGYSDAPAPHRAPVARAMAAPAIPDTAARIQQGSTPSDAVAATAAAQQAGQYRGGTMSPEELYAASPVTPQEAAAAAPPTPHLPRQQIVVGQQAPSTLAVPTTGMSREDYMGYGAPIPASEYGLSRAAAPVAATVAAPVAPPSATFVAPAVAAKTPVLMKSKSLKGATTGSPGAIMSRPNQGGAMYRGLPGSTPYDFITGAR